MFAPFGLCSKSLRSLSPLLEGLGLLSQQVIDLAHARIGGDQGVRLDVLEGLGFEAQEVDEGPQEVSVVRERLALCLNFLTGEEVLDMILNE